MFLKRHTADPDPHAPIHPASPASPPSRTHSESRGNIYRKTPPYCSHHHPKIPSLVKRRPRGQEDTLGSGRMFQPETPLRSHDSKAPRPTPQSPSHCEKDEDSRKALQEGGSGVRRDELWQDRQDTDEIMSAPQYHPARSL